MGLLCVGKVPEYRVVYACGMWGKVALSWDTFEVSTPSQGQHLGHAVDSQPTNNTTMD